MSDQRRATSDLRPTTSDLRLPLVSVIASCYNHSRFAVECLESIRQQTYTNMQLIIIDDCSRDDSVAVIKRWIAAHNVQCTLLTHAKNQGVCRSFNEALSHATGDYVAITSVDDVWMPRKLEEQVKVLESLPPEYGVVYSDAEQIDEQGKPLPKRYMETFRAFDALPTGDVFDELWRGNWLATMAMLMRRACFETVGYYDESLSLEDYDMWLRLARRYKFAYSPYVSCTYRIVSTSLIRTLGVRLVESNILVHLKWYGERPERDRQIEDYVLSNLQMLYKQGHAGRNRCFRRAAATIRLPRLRLMAACSIAGVPYRGFLGIEELAETVGRRWQRLARGVA